MITPSHTNAGTGTTAGAQRCACPRREKRFRHTAALLRPCASGRSDRICHLRVRSSSCKRWLTRDVTGGAAAIRARVASLAPGLVSVRLRAQPPRSSGGGRQKPVPAIAEPRLVSRLVSVSPRLSLRIPVFARTAVLSPFLSISTSHSPP
jgi:hypothetical protein